jgi:hypothetical protein
MTDAGRYAARLVRTPTAFMILAAIIAGCGDSTPNLAPPRQSQPAMTATFQLPNGIQVADLSGIREAYSVAIAKDGYHVFTVNVSAENIHDVFCRLAAEVNQPAFLLLETGTHRDVEQQLRKSDTDPFHKDVYYLDGLKWSTTESVLGSYAELFTHDGQLNFGFGSHEGHDEVFVGPYKLFTIYASEPAKYESALDELGFAKVERVKTVWDNFNENSPGKRNALTEATPTIWDMIEQLKEQGLYLAERRED